MSFLTLEIIYLLALYSMSVTTESLPSTKIPPEARKAMAMAFDPVSSRIIIYSGFATTSDNFTDMWSFDLKLNQWQEITWNSAQAPGGRLNSHMFFDDSGNKIFLLGGRNDKGPLLDVWSYDFSSKLVILMQ